MSELELIKRKLEREQAARREAERLLEDKARELYLAKEAAEATRARLDDAINSISQGFVLFDKDERLVLANARYIEMYPHLAQLVTPGRTMEELAQVHADAGETNGLGTEDRFVADRMERFRYPGEPWEQRQSDGRTILVSEKRTATGGFVSVRTDITALKKTEDLLRSRLAAIEAAEEGIAITDPQGVFTYMNREHAVMFGYDDPEEIIGKSWRTLYTEEKQKLVETEYFPILADNYHWRGEVDGLRADGTEFPQEISLTLLEDGGIVCATRDITHRRELADQQRLLREQFNQAQKMEAVGRLAGGIAHDFNNILAAMLGYANFLVEDLEAESEQHGFAVQIAESGERAKKLVQQLLAFSRHRESGFEETELGALTSSVVEMLRPTIPATISLNTALGCPHAMVNGNPTQIEQVLMNLVVNARDAMPNGAGEITLSVDVAASDPDRLLVLANVDEPPHAAEGLGIDTTEDGTNRAWLGRIAPERDYVRIRVADNGSGIDAETLAKIFEPFFTTKEQGKGTGLGLAAIQGIVAGHEGALVVRSKPGEGTNFTILLPLIEGLVLEDDTPAEPAAPAQARSELVLIVDDEPAVRSMIETGLRRAGYDTLAVEGGPAALEAFADDTRKIVAVVSDYMMPEMTGLELVKKIRARDADVPIIVCTGFSENVEKSEILNAGANMFLRKPLSTRDLTATLADLIPAAC